MVGEEGQCSIDDILPRRKAESAGDDLVAHCSISQVGPHSRPKGRSAARGAPLLGGLRREAPVGPWWRVKPGLVESGPNEVGSEARGLNTHP